MDQFLCDIAQVGAATHYLHVALHLGLAGIVSIGGGAFLALGFRARRRALLDQALRTTSSTTGDRRS